MDFMPGSPKQSGRRMIFALFFLLLFGGIIWLIVGCPLSDALNDLEDKDEKEE